MCYRAEAEKELVEGLCDVGACRWVEGGRVAVCRDAVAEHVRFDVCRDVVQHKFGCDASALFAELASSPRHTPVATAVLSEATLLPAQRVAELLEHMRRCGLVRCFVRTLSHQQSQEEEEQQQEQQEQHEEDCLWAVEKQEVVRAVCAEELARVLAGLVERVASEDGHQPEDEVTTAAILHLAPLLVALREEQEQETWSARTERD